MTLGTVTGIHSKASLTSDRDAALSLGQRALEAWRRWEKSCEAVGTCDATVVALRRANEEDANATRALARAEQVSHECAEAYDALVAELVETPAQTPQGLQLKLLLIALELADGLPEEPGAALARGCLADAHRLSIA